MQPLSKTANPSMNFGKYPEIQPKTKLVKKAYAFVMLLIVGRGIEAAARVDERGGRIFSELPEGFVFTLGVSPDGPYMLAGKDKSGRLRYLGWRRWGHKIRLGLHIKNLESAIKVFTFQESTALAYNYDRFSVEGSLPRALAVVRVLDIVEVYLLPKIIARLAVKRYPGWSELSPVKKHVNRLRIYLKIFSPSLVRVIYRNI